MLARRQRTNEQVLLLHVGAPRAQLVRAHAAPVDGASGAGRNLDAGRRPEGQRIEQRRLAGTAAAHDGEQLAGLRQAGHVLQQMLACRGMVVWTFVRLTSRQIVVGRCGRWRRCAARAAVAEQTGEMAQPLGGVLPERLRLRDLAVDVDVGPRVGDVRVGVEGDGRGGASGRAISGWGLGGLAARGGQTAVAAWRTASGRRGRAGVGQVMLCWFEYSLFNKLHAKNVRAGV